MRRVVDLVVSSIWIDFSEHIIKMCTRECYTMTCLHVESWFHRERPHAEMCLETQKLASFILAALSLEGCLGKHAVPLLLLCMSLSLAHIHPPGNPHARQVIHRIRMFTK